MGIVGNICVGGNINSPDDIYFNTKAGTIYLNPTTISTPVVSISSSTLTITSSTPSTNTSSGALVVNGGCGIGGALNVGGVLSTTSSTPSTNTSSGALVVTGGCGIGGDLNVGGSVSATSYSATSDIRIKQNIFNLHEKPEYSVDELKPVSYFNTLSGKEDIGFLAQDVEEIFPFMVSGTSDGYKNLNYLSMIGILVKEVQCLKNEIRLLKK